MRYVVFFCSGERMVPWQYILGYISVSEEMVYEKLTLTYMYIVHVACWTSAVKC